MNILDNFNDKQIEAINSIKFICKRHNIEVYIVGGAVRDGILNTPTKDIDICINADPKVVINDLENVKKYEYHEPFQTSTILFNNDIFIDLIRCRKEVYEQNGALPNVTPSDIKDDLFRRDFTVNALAYNLIEDKLIDFFNGFEDLKNNKLRKIHTNSYREDPTRIFRGIKYSVRYGLELVDKYEIIGALEENVLSTISNDRIIKEIISLCSEVKWTSNLMLCEELGILKLNRELIGLENPIQDYNEINLRLINLYYSLNDEKFLNVFLNNSLLDKQLKKSIKHYYNNNYKTVDLLANAMDNYELYKILKSLEFYELVLLCWNKKNVYKVMNYVYNLKDNNLNVNGDFIRSLGIEDGKTIGNILNNMMKLKLNTDIKDDEKYLQLNLGEIIRCL